MHNGQNPEVSPSARVPSSAPTPAAGGDGPAPGLRGEARAPLVEEQAQIVASDMIFAKYALSYAMARGLRATERVGEAVEITFETAPILPDGAKVPDGYVPDRIVMHIVLAPSNVRDAASMVHVWQKGPAKGAVRAPRLMLPLGTREIPKN